MRIVPFPAVAGAAWAVLTAQAAFHIFPEAADGFCPIRFISGYRCPGCGMGRALLAALRGNLAASWSLHPLAVPLLALWTAWLAWGLWNLSRGRAFSDNFLSALRRPAYSWAVLATVLVVHLARSI